MAIVFNCWVKNLTFGSTLAFFVPNLILLLHGFLTGSNKTKVAINVTILITRLSIVKGNWTVVRTITFLGVKVITISVTCKKLPNVYKKWPKTDFTRKMKEFDTFSKIALKMWQFGQNNCCHRLRKVAQSAINRPIWSHWSQCKPTSFIL